MYDHLYNTIQVNGYEVTFRFRDQNRIKVAHIKDDGFDLCPAIRAVLNIDEDDCNGEEFLKILNFLHS